MNGRATTLSVLSGLDSWARSRVVQASCAYPRMSSIGAEIAHVTIEYDGTACDFARAVEELRRNSELRALGTHLAVREVLEVMCDGTQYLDLGLDAVDAIVIQRVGRHLVRITRSGSAAPLSGRALFLELNDVRQRSADAIRDARVSATDHGFAIAVGLCFIGAAVIIAAILKK